MAERNLLKSRPCKLCGECVHGKASKLKEHAKECKKTHADAAAEAIMQAMQEDMVNDGLAMTGIGLVQTVNDALEDALAASTEKAIIKELMADERVLNAEGD